MLLSEILSEITANHDPDPAAFYGQGQVYGYNVGWPDDSHGEVVLHGKDKKVMWKCSHDKGRDLANQGKIKWHNNESIIRYLLQLGVL